MDKPQLAFGNCEIGFWSYNKPLLIVTRSTFGSGLQPSQNHWSAGGRSSRVHGLRFAYARAERLWTICPPLRNPPILPLLFAKKFDFLRHFWTRKRRLELRSCPFGPTLVSICRSVTELAAETRVGSNGQEPSSE